MSSSYGRRVHDERHARQDPALLWALALELCAEDEARAAEATLEATEATEEAAPAEPQADVSAANSDAADEKE